MEEIIAAIMTTFAANSTLAAACAGNLWFQEAAQTPTYPYGVLYFNNVIPDAVLPATTTTNRFEDYKVQFSFWDDDVDRTAIMTIEKEMKATFDYAKMTVSGYDNWSTKPTASRIIKTEERRWQLTMDYNIQVQKT